MGKEQRTFLRASIKTLVNRWDCVHAAANGDGTYNRVQLPQHMSGEGAAYIMVSIKTLVRVNATEKEAALMILCDCNSTCVGEEQRTDSPGATVIGRVGRSDALYCAARESYGCPWIDFGEISNPLRPPVASGRVP
jgi:hypothetical protein